jgi:TPR repeat protein
MKLNTYFTGSALAFTLLLMAANPAFASSVDDGFEAAQRGDFETAFQIWEPLAKEGNVTAQTLLGVMYYKGEGVTQDYKEAVKWYRKAAEQGYSNAQNNLAGMYFEGQGVPQDNVMAYFWWNLAAAEGNARSIKFRDRVKEMMTPSEIEEAQRLSREWFQQHQSK